MPLFYWGDTFIHEAAVKPGGLLDMAGRFAEQFYMIGWAGTAVMTLLVLAAWFLSGKVLRADSRGTESPLIQGAAALPACLLLLLSAVFDYPWMNTALQVVVALGLAWQFARMTAGDRVVGPVALFLAVAAATNHVGGVLAGLVFAGLAGLPDLTSSTKRVRGILVLALGIGISLFFVKKFHLDANAMLPGVGRARYITVALYLGVLILPLVPWFLERQPGTDGVVPSKLGTDEAVPSKGKRAEAPARKRSTPAPAMRVRLAGFIAWAMLAGSMCGGYFLVNKTIRAQAAVEFYASQHDWDHVIAAAGQLKWQSWSVRLAVNQALFNKGRLLEDLLNLPHTKGAGIVPEDYPNSMQAPTALAQTLFELGQVNLAEHWATEAFEMMGERPDLLQLMAKINAMKGRTKAAIPYAKFLRQNPFYRAWADDFLKMLATDPKMESNPEMARVRSVNVTTDYPTLAPPIPIYLKQLLHTNPKNRMAFEYLMAHYLLTAKAEQMVQALGQFESQNTLPRLIQEAVVDLELQQALPGPGRAGLEETRRRFEGFRHAVSAYQSDLEKGRIPVARTYGNTYWYFNVFEATGQLESR